MAYLRQNRFQSNGTWTPFKHFKVHTLIHIDAAISFSSYNFLRVFIVRIVCVCVSFLSWKCDGNNIVIGDYTIYSRHFIDYIIPIPNKQLTREAMTSELFQINPHHPFHFINQLNNTSNWIPFINNYEILLLLLLFVNKMTRPARGTWYRSEKKSRKNTKLKAEMNTVSGKRECMRKQ